MKEYPKIQSIYKRDEKTKKFIEGQWSLPELEYLKNNIWQWTEKIDGTNIRTIWIPESQAELDWGAKIQPYWGVKFKGKTDKADIPKFLLAKLEEMFLIEKMKEVFPDTSLCLYGEGYGAKIQSGGNYIPNGVSFVLFDVRIGEWWLKRKDVEGIAEKLGIDIVPIIMESTIEEAIKVVRDGFISTWSSHNASATSWCHEFKAEGLVGKPLVEMRDRRGHRIVTKLKTKDFIK